MDTRKYRLESGDLGTILRFDITEVVADDSDVPDVLRPIEYIDESESVITRTRELNRTRNRTDLWVINDQLYDPDRIDAYPQLDTVEIWEFVNRNNMDHPMHIHDVMFQILDINGEAVNRDPGVDANASWKDTVNIPPQGGRVRVIMRFSDFTGRYVFHCHNVEHEMMGQFEVIK